MEAGAHPRPKPTKVLSPDSAQFTLRGKLVTKPCITLVDSGFLGAEIMPFYEATFTTEVAEMKVHVVKCSDKQEELKRECLDITEASGVQVSGQMTNSAGRESCDLLVLGDQWFAVRRDAHAPPQT